MSEAHSGGPGHEIRDVNFRGLLNLSILTVVLGGLVLLGVWWFFQDLRERRMQQMPPANPLAIEQGERLPPPPRLEGIEQMNGKVPESKSALNSRPNSYGWVDRKAEIVRVPVDRAMTLIAEKKLIPSAPPDLADPDLDNPYRFMPSPANSGRGAPWEQP